VVFPEEGEIWGPEPPVCSKATYCQITEAGVIIQYNRDYLQVCAIYSCRQFNSLSRLRLRMEEHFGAICAAREF